MSWFKTFKQFKPFKTLGTFGTTGTIGTAGTVLLQKAALDNQPKNRVEGQKES